MVADREVALGHDVRQAIYEDRLIMYALGYRSAAELDERIVTFNALHNAHLLRPLRRGKIRDRLTQDKQFFTE